MVVEAVRKSETLIEALPYIKAFHGKIVVIKLGGSAQEDDILRNIFTDIDFMLAAGMQPVVVFGGGKLISEAMLAAGLEPRFVEGQRITEPEAMQIVSRVLNDEVGAKLLRLLQEAGGAGEILNGRDHAFLRAIKKRLPEHPEIDLGCVGEPVAIDAAKAISILERRRVPLVAPVGCGVGSEAGQIFNINGDNASALVARDLHAEKIVFLSDVPGICREPGNPDTLCSHLTGAEVRQLLADGVIAGGMIPKVEACLQALEGGVKKAHIVPGAQPHALLLEIFTRKGVGTEIVL